VHVAVSNSVKTTQFLTERSKLQTVGES